jgi:pantetheine-phosphate adenylyltransferase
MYHKALKEVQIFCFEGVSAERAVTPPFDSSGSLDCSEHLKSESSRWRDQYGLRWRQFGCVNVTHFRYNVSLRCASEHRMRRAYETMKNVLAIYPGSFDPVTNGHLDLIERGAKIFDRLVVSVLRNLDKDPLFSLDERVEMLREVTRPWANVEIDVFSGLLVEYARLREANVILRGIRAVSDYEYELQMAMMNRKLNKNVETVFMMPAVSYSFLSSRLVREIARLGGPISGLVPPVVEERLRAKVL